MVKHWSTVGSLVWLFWFVFFLGYELFTGIERKKDIPMLTQAVVRYVPWYVTLGFIVWLFAHFATRYANPTYLAWLKAGNAGLRRLMR